MKLKGLLSYVLEERGWHNMCGRGGVWEECQERECNQAGGESREKVRIHEQVCLLGIRLEYTGKRQEEFHLHLGLSHFAYLYIRKNNSYFAVLLKSPYLLLISSPHHKENWCISSGQQRVKREINNLGCLRLLNFDKCR